MNEKDMLDEIGQCQYIEVDYLRMGGKPVLKGTRFPISSVMAEVQAGRSLVEIAEDFDLDKEQINECLSEAGWLLDFLSRDVVKLIMKEHIGIEWGCRHQWGNVYGNLMGCTKCSAMRKVAKP